MSLQEIRQALLAMNDLREQINSFLTWEHAEKETLYQQLEAERLHIEEAADDFTVRYLAADRTYALVPTEAK